LFHGAIKYSKIIVKERELGIPDSRGVSKLFVPLPFAEIKRFLPWWSRKWVEMDEGEGGGGGGKERFT